MTEHEAGAFVADDQQTLLKHQISARLRQIEAANKAD